MHLSRSGYALHDNAIIEGVGAVRQGMGALSCGTSSRATECVVIGGEVNPGSVSPEDVAEAGALRGITCGCHYIGEPERSWSYAWLATLALGLAARRRSQV